MEYLDFDLEIGPGQGREYPVIVRSPAGEARATMLFPFDELALENRLLTLQNALLRSGGHQRRALSPEEQTVQDFGRDLFRALIGGEVRSRFDVSLQQAQQQRKGLRLKLRFQAPELAALPWEFLYDHQRGEYICLSKNTPTIRYLELPQPITSLTVTPPLRILGMMASPTDLPRLDVDREQQRIENAVQDLQKEGFIELTWLPGQTWRDLAEAMLGGPWHVFHFIGHGGFDPNTDEGIIALADEQGQKHLLTANQVGGLLADHQDLRLVVLNSCEGAKGGKLDIYSSTAAILVRRGIAAVLAMQYEITDRAAIEFARTFYWALTQGLPIDAAVGAARVAVNIEVENSLEWGTPVLYMRSPDGVLFDLAGQPEVRPKPVLDESMDEPPPSESGPREVKQGRLWIETDPPDAAVAILNLQSEFTQGLELEPGRYEIEVAAAGFETQKEWLELGAGEDRHLRFKLMRRPAAIREEMPTPALNESEPAAAPGQEAPGPGPEIAAARPESAIEGTVPPRPGKSLLPRIGAGLILAVVLIMGGWWLLSTVSSTKTIIEPRPADKMTAQPMSAKMKSFTNSMGMTFVPIPAGTFERGSPADVKGRKDDERQHQVTTSRPFYLQTTEVTQGQWQKVMGSNAAHFNRCGMDCPVESISWNDAQEFIRKLNQMENTDRYRLPTEAEWEWASLSKSPGRYCFGDNEAGLTDHAWFLNNSANKIHPVGQLKPNAWGLYDMHGNVWEWCQDWYGEYPAGPVTDPQGPLNGKNRVVRGGAYFDYSWQQRSANRSSYDPINSRDDIGFRVARTF